MNEVRFSILEDTGQQIAFLIILCAIASFAGKVYRRIHNERKE